MDYAGMKSVVIALVGRTGGGTAKLGMRAASILNWQFASFGAYVRFEAAREGLRGSLEDRQDTGEKLARDPVGFCRAVVSTSGWQPGKSLVVDGLRHPPVLEALKDYFAPFATEVVVVGLYADFQSRELRLQERGEIGGRDIEAIDKHPVEKDVSFVLSNAVKTVDGDLSEGEKIDQLIEYLIQVAEINPLESVVTSENLVRVPNAVRDELGWKAGDYVQFSVRQGFAHLSKVTDENRNQNSPEGLPKAVPAHGIISSTVAAASAKRLITKNSALFRRLA